MGAMKSLDQAQRISRLQSRRVSSGIVLPILAMAVLALSIHPSAAAAGAVVQNDSMWISSSSSLWIFGEVKNTGDVWLQSVKITATLQDANNATIDVVFSYTEVQYVPPDVIAPFRIEEVDTAKSAQVTSYSLAVEFQEAQPIPVKLAIMNISDSKSSLGYLEVFGELENLADAPSMFTKVCGTFYDETGKVIYVGSTYPRPPDIPAGGKNPFTLTVERASNITRYTLLAESMNSGYTSVPELSSSTLVLIAAISLTAVAMRKKRLRDRPHVSSKGSVNLSAHS
jgi:hypothetical protein